MTIKKTTFSFLIGLLFTPELFAQSAPGGVSESLNYWLKADAGVTLSGNQVSQWANQTSTSGFISQSNSPRQPSLTTNALNFNPAISFNTAGGDFDFLSTDDLVWDSNTVILVFNPTQNSGNGGTLQAVLVYNIPNNARGDAGIGIGSISNNTDNFFNSTDITPAQPGEYLATSRVSANTTGDSVLAVVRQDTVTNPTRSQLRFWGEDANANIANLNQFSGHQNTEFTIGQRDGGGLPFDGDVLEAISYSSRLDDASLQRIESYLSIKYGLTLNQSTLQDYVNSSAQSIYDADGTLSDYVANITGIGRDDDSGLNQKQSISTTTNSVQTNNEGLVTIGLGTIAATNSLNTNSFTNDQTFMLWGNNAASIGFNSALSISSIPLNRMQRTWAIQETGNVNTVRLNIPQAVFDNDLIPSILISTDPDFNNIDQAITLIGDGSGNYTATVNFADGNFFTFAQSEEAVEISTGNPNFFVIPTSDGRTVIFEL